MACADLPAFPLQLLLKKHPEWRGHPAAVVDEDKPQGILLWVNEEARRLRVLSGMRYAAGLSLARELRAGVLPRALIEEEIEVLVKRLRFFSPDIEPARSDPGTFWIGGEGLSLLHPSFRKWAELIRSDLASAGYTAHVAVGFSRFGSYAAARAAGDGASGDIVVFCDAAEERAAVRRIPIERIACDPDFRDTLARLGILELGGFLDLPPTGVRRRFGAEALALHRMAAGESWAPLEPEPAEEPHERRFVFDHPESDTGRILLAVEEELHPLLDRLRARSRALSALILDLSFERPAPDGTKLRQERIRPARPTRDPRLLLDLLRLRLESIVLPSGLSDLRIEVEWIAAGAEQMGLFAERPRRDLEAANRALARVRAEFGDEAVGAVRLREAHLPEARFAVEPLERLGEAHPRKVRMPPLVRRILARPEGIVLLKGTAPPEPEPRGCRIPGLGTVAEAVGPYHVSGGWWRRPVARRYWYVRLEGGVWIWIYHDARRKRWFRQGEVE